MPQMTVELRAQTESARTQVVSALNAMNREALTLARQLNGLSSAMATQREAVDRARAAYQNTSDRIKHLKDNVKQFKDELSNTNTALDNNQAKMERARAATERYQQKLDDAIATHGAFSKEAYRAGQQLDNAARRAGAAQAAIAGLSTRKRELRQQITETNRQIAALNTQLVAEGNTLHGATQRAAELAAQKARLATQARDLQTSITNTNRQLSELTKTLREDDKAIRDNQQSMTSSVVAANLLTGAFRAVRDFTVGLIKETVTYAARTYELGIVMEQVARVNGITVGQIRAQEKAIRDLNISTQEARQVLAQFVAAQMDVTKASTLARTAQDLAVISGAESAETFQRLTQGIQTLQIRVLRTAGVYVSLDTALDRAAKASGRQRDSFSQLEKQNILLNTVLDYGARVTGTYDAAMQSASKQMRSMIRIWNDAKNALGSLLQGPFALGIKLATQLLKVIAESPKATVLFLGAITILAGKIAYFTAINMGWAASFKEVAVAMKDATASALGLQSASASQAATAATGAAANGGGAYYSLGGAFRAMGGTRTLGVAAGAIGGGALGAAAGGSAGAGIGAGLGTAATLLGTGLSATGIGAIAVGVGALTYALHSYVTARKDATRVDEEDLELALRRLRTNREDIAAFEERARQIRASNGAFYELHDQQREYALAVGRLTPVVQANISAESDRATALQRVANALREVNQETARSIINQGRDLALAIGADDVSIRQAGGRYRGISGLRSRFSQGRAGVLDTGRAWVKSILGYGATPGEIGAGGGGGLATMESEAFSDYNTAMESRRRHFESLAKAAYTLNKELGISNTEFLNQIEVLKNNPALMQEAIKEIQNYTAAEEERQRRMREGIVAYQEFQEQIKEALGDLNSGTIEVRYTQEGLNKQLTIAGQTLRNSMALTQDWSTSVGIASNQLGYLDETLVKLGGSQEGYNALIARLLQTQPDVAAAIYTLNSQGSKAVSKFGEDAANAANKLADVQSKIRNLRREVTELASGAGEAGRLEILVSQLENIRSMQQQIIDQRTKLGRPQGSISQSAEDMEEEIRRNKNELEVIESIRERLFRLESLEADVQKEQIGYDVVRKQYLDDEFRRREVMLRAQLLFDQSNNERLETEKKITAEIIAQGAERRRRAQEQNASNAEVRRFMLEQINAQQKVLSGIEEATNRERAELALRRNRTRITNGLLGEYGGAVTASVPNLQRQSLAINELPPAVTQLSALNTISNHTFNIANAVTQTLPQILQTLQNPPAPGSVAGALTPTAPAAAPGPYTSAANAVTPQGNLAIASDDTKRQLAEAVRGGITSNRRGSLTLLQQLYAVPEVRAFLNTIRAAEGGQYNLLHMGGGTFTPGASIPNWGGVRFNNKGKISTTHAFGAYGFQPGTYKLVTNLFPGLSNATTPEAQDLHAIGNMLRSDRNVMYPLLTGDFSGAAAQAGKEWASFPGPIAHGRPRSVKWLWNTFQGQLGQAFTPFMQSPTSPAATTMQQAVNQITGQNPDSRADVINKQLTDELMKRDAAKLARFGAPEPTDPEVERINSATFKEVQVNAEEAKRLIQEFGKVSDENVRDFYNNIDKEMSIYEDVFTTVKNNFDGVKDSIRTLAAERELDASGWQESQAHLIKITVDGEIARRRAARETKDEILRLQDEIAHVTEGSADRIEAAYLRAVKEIKMQNENAAADVRIALAKIEDAGEFHNVRAQARITQWAASMKSRTDIYADAVTGTFDAVFGVLDTGFDRATSKLGIFGGVIKQVMSDLTRMFLSRAFMKLFPQFFGTGGAASSGQTGGVSGGGVANTAANFGLGILGGFGGGNRATGGPTGFGTSVFNPGAPSYFGAASMGFGGSTAVAPGFTGAAGTDFYGNPIRGNAGSSIFAAAARSGLIDLPTREPYKDFGNINTVTPSAPPSVGPGGGFLGSIGGYFDKLSKIPTTGLAKVAALKGAAGIGAQAAGMLPLIGGGLGGMLTQGGGTLASIGGTAAGTMLGLAGMYGIQAALTQGAIATGAGANMGALAAFALNPFVIGGAAIALVGLAIYSKNKQRRKEEQARDQMIREAKAQVQKLLEDVRRDHIDGDSALVQAQQIRDQYMQNVATLKDKKTRRHAELTVREIDVLIKQLETAALQQRRRREIDANLVPEFATGGVVPGIDMGRDSVLAALRPGEIVLNRRHINNLSRITSPDIFRQIGVPGFDQGGVVRPVTMYQTQTVTNNTGMGGNIYIVTSQRYAEDMVRRAGGTILNMVDSAITNREGLYSTVRGAAR